MLSGYFKTAFREECLRDLEAKQFTGEPLTAHERLAVHVMIGTVIGDTSQLRAWAESPLDPCSADATELPAARGA